MTTLSPALAPVCAAVLLALAAPLGALAQPAAATVPAQATFQIPAGDMKAALEAYIAQSGRQVVFRVDDVRGERSPGVQGAMGADAALTQLLSGTALTVVREASGALLVVRAAAASQSASDVQVVEITGTLRRTDLQKTALAVTALTGASLRDQGADSISDAAYKVPGLQIMDRGPNDKKFVIRGIQNDVAVGGNTVGIYIDEFPVSLAGIQLDMNLFDVDRVEVLRGPQGTLYGASSMTGTIKYITRRPDTQQFDALVQVGAATTQDGAPSWSLDAMLNVPLSQDVAALRLVAYKRHTGGYIDRTYAGEDVPAFAGVPADGFFPGSPPVRGHDAYTLAPITTRDSNSYDVHGGRLTLLAEPIRGLTLTGAMLSESGYTADRNAYQPTAGDLNNAVSIKLPLTKHTTLTNLTAEWDLGATALYASLNHARHRMFYIEQFTGVFPAELTPPGTELTTEMKVSATSQELRWRSNTPESSLSWLVGAWNYRASTPFHQIIQIQQTQDLRVVDQSTPQSDAQWALFGELAWRFVPSVTATVGLRHWVIDQRFGPNMVYIDPAIFFLDPKGEQTARYGYKDSLNSYKYNLSWQVDEQTLLYAQAAQGFRLGGFNGNPTNDPNVPLQYKSDSLWNYELGAKGMALDRTLRYSLAAYHVRWADIQTRVFVNGAGFNGNAGRAHSRGLEFELGWRATPQWDFSANGALMDARLDEDQPANPDFPTGVEGKAGDRLPGVPRVTFSLGAQYTMPAWGDSELVLRADASHVGDSYTRFRADPPANPSQQARLSAYNMVNLRATLRHESWEAGAYVTNAFNTRPVLDVYDFLGQTPLVTTARPRTLGVRLAYRF